LTKSLSYNKLSVLTKINSSAILPKLSSLRLASCNLREFPNFLRDQDRLEFLDLAFNNIDGQVPQWFWKTSTQTLLYLDIAHNFLTGFDQPPSVLPWSSLLDLNMSSNRLHGLLPVPPFSTFLYSISNNSLSGEIPSSFCNLSLLQVLDLSWNNLSGMIPRCLGNFSTSLSILNLGGNNFHGTIPQTWTSASKLKMINLGQNKLQGQVPRSMAKCELLESLDLGNNQINDAFPS
jgi:Leucine-rich repeat (LRR) protein